MVENLIKISPSTVSLSGSTDQVLKTHVDIAPVGDFKFKITQLKTRFKTGVKASLVPPSHRGDVWRVNIQAQSKTPDEIYEVINLTTDNPAKPRVIIRVFVTFLAKS